MERAEARSCISGGLHAYMHKLARRAGRKPHTLVPPTLLARLRLRRKCWGHGLQHRTRRSRALQRVEAAAERQENDQRQASAYPAGHTDRQSTGL